MFKNTKKSVNWLVEEFTSIDLVAAIEHSDIRSSVTTTIIEAAGNKNEYVSSKTTNDKEGRPMNTKHFNEDNEVEEEYRYEYKGNVQRITLLEGGKDSCTWVNTYDDNKRLIRSEFSESADATTDIETFEYDKEGRLVQILVDIFPKEEGDDEPPTGFELIWEGNRLNGIIEFYGEEEDARVEFDYDDDNKVTSVKKIMYVMDEDEEMAEEVVDEHCPVYNEKGQLIQNTIHYYPTNSKLVIQYEYAEDDDTITRTVHSDYEGNTLVRNIEFFEDEKGNLVKSIEHFAQSGVTKTELYTYGFA